MHYTPSSMASSEMPLFREAHIPVLGICLGHQAMGWNFDAELTVGAESEHGAVAVRTTAEGAADGLFRGLPEEFPVEAMHHVSVAVPEGFTHLAESDGCVNQAHVGPNGLLYGVQFHPERSGEVGDAIFENFARMAYDLESQPMAA